MDFRIAGNHRSSDDQYDDHNNEFHVALTMLPSQSNGQCSAYILLQRRQVTQVGAGAKEWSAESVKRFAEADSAGNFYIGVGKDLGGESLDG